MGLAHTWRVKGEPFQRMQLLRFMGGAEEEGLMSFPNKYPPKRRGQMLSASGSLFPSSPRQMQLPLGEMGERRPDEGKDSPFPLPRQILSRFAVHFCRNVTSSNLTRQGRTNTGSTQLHCDSYASINSSGSEAPLVDPGLGDTLSPLLCSLKS